MPFYVLHPKEIEHVRRQKKASVIDLRAREEYQRYHYPYAVNIPYEEKECWIRNFKRRNWYILYCEYGNVSLMSARKLAKIGVNAYTVTGGIEGIKRYDKYFKD